MTNPRDRRTFELPSSQVTDEALVRGRRAFLRDAGLLAAGASVAAPLTACFADEPARAGETGALPASSKDATPANTDASGFVAVDEPTSFEDASSYNNFYEFGTDKTDPARYAGSLVTKPWSVAIEGEVARPGVIGLEDLLKPHTTEERIYRLRCVEAWSMVIPWSGVPLGDVLARFEPTSRARYVAFETLYDPKQMPGQRRRILDWPYREGLRMDEAMHPLALLATGMYGRDLPNQNGAPLRLVVPWKYGFKSIKSIVKIRLQSEQPSTSWNDSAAAEYGFYANVNPAVSHPRWSQKRERRIGEFRKRPTLPFNGYAEQVASLYQGMDLRKLY